MSYLIHIAITYNTTSFPLFPQILKFDNQVFFKYKYGWEIDPMNILKDSE